MKRLLGILVTGMLGGAMSFFAIQAYHPTTQINATNQALPTKQVSLEGLTGLAPDFAFAAEKSMPVVVQIKAEESESLAQNRLKQEQRRINPYFDQGFNFFDFPMLQQFQYKQKGSGSGVILTQDGYVVTNNHVIDFADNFEVILSDNRKFKGKLIGRDPKTDLAVIKIEATGLPTLEYADANRARVGEWVLAVGNPFEYLTSTVTAGIISAKGRDLNLLEEKGSIEEFIQTDAAVNPGNSGGALVDQHGKLLGINTAIATKTGYYSGYSFAIPVNLMDKIAKDIIKNGDKKYAATSSFETEQPARLGVYFAEIDAEYKNTLNLKSNDGVVITELVQGGAAQYAGLLPNDVIIKIDDAIIQSAQDLQMKISKSKVGETLSLRIIRNGSEKTIPVKLKAGI